MTRLLQTEFGNKRGNCFATCIAMLMGLPVSEVPNFCSEYPSTIDEGNTPAWYVAADAWLQERGFRLIDVAIQDDTHITIPPGTPCMFNGKSPRGPFNHVVVGIALGEGKYEIIDPHPDGTGLVGVPMWCGFIVKAAPQPERLKVGPARCIGCLHEHCRCGAFRW